MRWITLILFLLCTLLIQGALLQHISPWGIRPDLFIIFVMFFSFRVDIKQVSLLNFIVGITKDVFSAGPLGLNAFLFIICGFFISIFKDRIFREHPVTQIVITFSAAMIYSTMYVIILSISSHQVIIVWALWKVPAAALYTALLVPLVYRLLQRFSFPLVPARMRGKR